jgi:hypothetical protein
MLKTIKCDFFLQFVASLTFALSPRKFLFLERGYYIHALICTV